MKILEKDALVFQHIIIFMLCGNEKIDLFKLHTCYKLKEKKLKKLN